MLDSTFNEIQKVCNLHEMEKLAAELAATLKAGDVVCLFGNLGSGKTTFVKALVRSLGGRDDVTSPTFNIMQSYNLGDFNLLHFDLYRIKQEEELEYIGIPDVFNGMDISIIEWPEVALNYLPDHLTRIYISSLQDPNKRLVKIIDN